MLLRELFVNPKKHLILSEGGNLSSDSPGWQGDAGHQADEINLKVNNRSHMVGVIDQLLHSIDEAFKQDHKQGMWSPELLSSKQFLGGSSLHFLNTRDISDEQFAALKPKVGDIDTQVDKRLEPQVQTFLQSNINKQIGNSTLLGFSKGNEQYNALFQLVDPPVKLQIDFEFGKYDDATGTPDEWFRFSHSSDWADIQAGIKGVFHKYLYRSLSGLSTRQFYVAKLAGRGKARAVQISDTPETHSITSFAVSSSQGGGVSQKYQPYIDPETDQPMTKDGLPVMEPIDAKDRPYIQNLSQQFQLLFGVTPTEEDSKLQQSFVGTLDLINKYVDQSKKADIVEKFLDICFEVGSQMITKDDPARDAQTKFVAIDVMLKKLDLAIMRPKAIEMAKAYEDDFNEVEAYKKDNPDERQPRAALKKAKALQQLQEAEVVAKLRKGMPHLRNLPPADLLDLLDEIHDGNGNFKIQNIPLNVKVDGFGGRFGKNAEGKPFMGTSRTPPRYEANFAKYHQEKGTTDPEILGRAQLFDQLFEEMMKAVELVDDRLGPEFLVNKQVTCEVLFLPFATETEEGKLKFVGINYDKLPKGVELALVPFHISDASSGEDVKNASQLVKALTGLGQQGSVMFINNALTQNGALDVTGIVPPLENIEELKSMLTSKEKGINDRKRQVAAALHPVAIALEKAIIADPNIIGKDMLGKDYEGIVLNTRLGPIKVTSAEQRQVVANKQDAIAAAREARKAAGGATRTKTAVITAGSFVGHKGHEQLVNLVLEKSDEVDGDAFVYISPTVGPDDPIPPEMKLETWQKLYPNRADMFHVWQEGGSPVKKIEKELVLPPDSPYKHIILMVGSDRYAGMKKWMDVLAKRMKDPRYPGSHNDVTFETIETKREEDQGGTGITFTQCRKALSLPDEKALPVWTRAFDVKKLGIPWIKKLMSTARQVMNIKPRPSVDDVSNEPVSTEPVNKPQEIKPTMPSIDKIDKDIPAPIAAKLKERQLSEQIKEMTRSLEESTAAKITKRHSQSSRGISTYSDAEKANSDYVAFKLGQAMASTDGKFVPEIDAKSWYGKKKTVHPYTEIENEMFKKAAKAVGASYDDVNHGDMKSKELDDTYKTSPVAKIKKNRFGV